ncbi:uncharacterized protein LOC113290426 [Papaver somniferum]|uniref:uncharacterized protein LOC113290426 n=1 Tax=Papaver somniferum TaxID=3469 RepID=UPI000E6F80A6|nr:uncharacterized protein LOC113290426 [Papaver somniferum]
MERERMETFVVYFNRAATRKGSCDVVFTATDLGRTKIGVGCESRLEAYIVLKEEWTGRQNIVAGVIVKWTESASVELPKLCAFYIEALKLMEFVSVDVVAAIGDVNETRADERVEAELCSMTGLYWSRGQRRSNRAGDDGCGRKQERGGQDLDGLDVGSALGRRSLLEVMSYLYETSSKMTLAEYRRRNLHSQETSPDMTLGEYMHRQRLKQQLEKIISTMQAAYVPGRQIGDNIMLAYELIHYINRKKTKKGYMALKLDMSKAFVRVEWSFLNRVTEQLGFSSKWCGFIQEFVSTTEIQVLLNGSPRQAFKPLRGIRQGDPISPYLFLLTMEVFTRALAKAEMEEKIQGIKISRKAPQVTHLLFALVNND